MSGNAKQGDLKKTEPPPEAEDKAIVQEPPTERNNAKGIGKAEPNHLPRTHAEPPPHPDELRSPQEKSEQHRLHPPERRMAICGPLLAVTLIAMAVIYGIWRHIQLERAQQQFSQAISKISVNVVTAQRDTKPYNLKLPGNIQAYIQTTIYARTNGYVGRWLVDIGDQVKEGQLLAEIETPEVDQELEQARSSLNQAVANTAIAKLTARRWAEMANRKVVAWQENDEKQAAYAAALASEAAARANVQRLQQLQGFKRVLAPFDGTITVRSIDTGALVSAGSGAAGTALFSMAQSDPLRIYVNLPQENVPAMREGVWGTLTVREVPGQQFKAKVVRLAGALDPTSRTRLTEIEIPNPEHVLLAGMYGEVDFTLSNENGSVVVPANTVMFRSEGPSVAEVMPDNRIHWSHIEIGKDFGTTIEAVKGIPENRRIVINPTDDLQEGLEVDVKSSEPVTSRNQPATAKGNQTAGTEQNPSGTAMAATLKP